MNCLKPAIVRLPMSPEGGGLCNRPHPDDVEHSNNRLRAVFVQKDSLCGDWSFSKSGLN